MNFDLYCDLFTFQTVPLWLQPLTSDSVTFDFMPHIPYGQSPHHSWTPTIHSTPSTEEGRATSDTHNALQPPHPSVSSPPKQGEWISFPHNHPFNRDSRILCKALSWDRLDRNTSALHVCKPTFLHTYRCARLPTPPCKHTPMCTTPYLLPADFLGLLVGGQAGRKGESAVRTPKTQPEVGCTGAHPRPTTHPSHPPQHQLSQFPTCPALVMPSLSQCPHAMHRGVHTHWLCCGCE